MGTVINLQPFKKLLSPEELQQSCSSFVLERWESAKKKNILRDFFVETAVSADPSKMYIDDLNVLSHFEVKIGLSPQIVAPSFNDSPNKGWIVAFRINGSGYYTPFMESELHARAFAILLYQKLKRELG